MAWKKIEDTIPVQNEPMQSIQESQKDSNLQRLGQFATGLGVRAAQAPFNLAELAGSGLESISSALGLPKVERKFEQAPSEYIESFFDKKNIEPENILTKSLQMTAGNWPLLLLGTGSLPFKIGADIAGSLGMTASEKLGAGSLGQIGAGILASKGFGNLAGSIKKSLKQPNKIGEFKTNLYNQERELGSKIKVNTDEIRNPLTKLYTDVEKQFVNTATFNDAAKSRVLDNILTADKLIAKPDLNAADVFEIKKLLNQAYAPAKSIENKFYQKLRSIFSNTLENIGESNKQWSNAYKTADQLHAIENWQSALGKSLDSISQSGKLGKLATSPLTHGALSLLAGGAIGPKAAGIAGGILAGKVGIKSAESAIRATKFIDQLSKSKDGQKILWDIVIDSAKNNSSDLLKNINKLNKQAIKFDQENKEQKSISRWKKIS